MHCDRNALLFEGAFKQLFETPRTQKGTRFLQPKPAGRGAVQRLQYIHNHGKCTGSQQLLLPRAQGAMSRLLVGKVLCVRRPIFQHLQQGIVTVGDALDPLVSQRWLRSRRCPIERLADGSLAVC